MDELVRHLHDEDHYYNGSAGEWTVCGQEWVQPGPGDTEALPGCTDCLDKWVPKHERQRT